MAHKTLKGGTAYNITGGKVLKGGTAYNIAGGRVLKGGTGYDISFTTPVATTAMLYSDGNFVFQKDDTVASGKTLKASYTDYEDVSTPPWNGKQNTFTSVDFKGIVEPTTMALWFNNAQKIVANTSKFDNLVMNNVTNMFKTFWQCFKLTGSPVCGPNVTNMSNVYYGCKNLTGSPVCGPNVTNMDYAYYNCHNLTGSPVCGSKVNSLRDAYNNCGKLTGNPVCGKNVKVLQSAYCNCQKLTGSPVCGDKVVYMAAAYRDCRNLTGSPVCGKNVWNMKSAYYNCINLTGKPVFGNNVFDISYAYAYCSNLNAGNIYIYVSYINYATSCFKGKNNSRRYNLYVPAGSNTLNRFLNNDTNSLVGANITWTQSGTTYYNKAYNIYIYATL